MTAPPPLARHKWLLILLAALVAGYGFHASGAGYFHWPRFWSVGFGIQGGMVFFAIQAFFPLANVVIFPALSLGGMLAGIDFLGIWGYLAGAVALAVWLTAQRPRRSPPVA
ncbi:MAG: hypothetical protein H7841_07825 [Magnetospirillum sp. WYHS-4]